MSCSNITKNNELLREIIGRLDDMQSKDMQTATLTYDLGDVVAASNHKIAVNASEISLAIHNFLRTMRSNIKYSDENTSPSFVDGMEYARTLFYESFEDVGIDTDIFI